MPSRPYNILYLSSFGSMRGGGQQSLFYLASNLDKEVFHPHVVLPIEGSLVEKLRAHDIEVTVLNLPGIINLNLLKGAVAFYQLLTLCRSFRIDLIHTDGPRNTFYAGLVSRIKGIPLIWHIRASNRDRYDRLLYHLSSKIILVADALKSRFDRIGKSTKYVTVYNGIDLSEFEPKDVTSRIRPRYNVGVHSLLIAVTGRIERLKGQKYLLEACGRIKEILKDFSILLLGEITESSYLKECKDRARELGIEDKVIFAGYQTGVPDILRETDIFVLPSLFEAFPRAVIEAMGAGKPVIVTDVGGCSEAVEDHVSGFVVPAKDSKLLADKISLLGKDKALREKMGKAARIRAEKMFSIEENVKKTERLYAEVLK